MMVKNINTTLKGNWKELKAFASPTSN